MMPLGSNRRIYVVHCHSGTTIAGLAADSKQIMVGAKSEANNYDSVYGDPISVKKLGDVTCRLGFIEVAKIIYGVRDEAKVELKMSWVLGIKSPT